MALEAIKKELQEAIERIPEPPRISAKWLWTVFGPGAIIAALTIGSGELVWTPRAAGAFGYVIAWAFFYGIWVKAVVMWMANRYFVVTGEPAAHATKRILGSWFNLLMLVSILAVMPTWYVILGSLSAQVPWTALGRPAPLYVFFVPIVVLTVILIATAAWRGVAYTVLEKLNQFILFAMFIALWIAVAIAVRPDWGALFANLLIPRVPEYEPWIQQAAPDIWALTPFILIGTALGALGGGIQDYVGYNQMLQEKRWGLTGYVDKLFNFYTGIKRGRLDVPSNDKLKGWLKVAAFDTSMSFFMVFIVTLPAIILTVEILRPMQKLPSGLSFVEAQVLWLAATLGSWAAFLWWLGAFFALWGTFYGLWEVYAWTIYSMLRNTFPARLKGLTMNKVRLYLWIYLLIVGNILFVTGASLPILAAFATAATHLFALALWGIALLVLNNLYLPKEYRPHPLITAVTAVGSAVYLVYGMIQLIQVFIPIRI